MKEFENWWKEGVIYQIYPRSFYDLNDDGIGDLPGITEKLDYLTDLGVDALWLSPIYPSPDIDFGYDVSDYRSIDPKFGTLEDFNHLVEEAHKRDLRIVLDMVMNHTSDQHPWFLESRSSRQNPYRDWYIWKDCAPNGGYPNNWASIFEDRGWEWDAQTGQYYFHMFARQQPDLNWRNPAVRAEMLDIYRFWCDRGVDGFRLDVFNAYYKDAQFKNNPLIPGLRRFDQQKHIHDINQPEMIPLLGDLRSLLDSYPEKYAVGETFMDSHGIVENYCGNGLLHAAFDFGLLQSSWNPEQISKAIQEWETRLGEKIWPTQVLSNHDNPRSATRYHARNNDQRLKQAAALLLTLRGTPFLYYGEEIGLRDIHVKRKDILDPVGKKYWPFHKGRDGCRAPMQWNTSRYAGFSQAKPWLPTNIDYTQRNVEKQSSNPDSLFNFYKSLISLRRQHPALRVGDFRPIVTEQKSILAFLRETEEETILIAINFSSQPASFTYKKKDSLYGWNLLLSNLRKELDWSASTQVTLKAEEIMIFN